MTLETLIDRTLRLLGESVTGDGAAHPVFWTRAQITRYLNDAYVDTARDTGALEIRTGVISVAGQGDYDTPDEVSIVQRVAYDDYGLKADTARSLDRLNPAWQVRTGQPERWLKSRKNTKTFTIYKIPEVSGPAATVDVDGNRRTGADYGKIIEFTGDTSVTFSSEYGRIVMMHGTGFTYTASSEYGRICKLDISQANMSIWGKKTPKLLVEDADEPELPLHSHMGLCFRAAQYALGAERDGRNEELAQVYEGLADEYEEYLRNLVNLRLPERDQSPSYGRAVDGPMSHNLYRNRQIPATGLPGAL